MPQNDAEINTLNSNVAFATISGGNPNVFWPLPGAKLFTAQFDSPKDVVQTSVNWFTLKLSEATCPQLPKNSFVWMQLVPKSTITIPPANFYDGIRWLGAQNFLSPGSNRAVRPWGVGA